MRAFIPHGAYWSTPFARWQGALWHLHAIRLAADVTRAALAERNLPPEGFDWRRVVNSSSSLIWGTRRHRPASDIERSEALEITGGGYGLFQGRAAGDPAMAVLVRPT